jgi:hypothetical protein
MYNDDDFNWNHGVSLAATGQFKAAEEAFLLVQNEKSLLKCVSFILLHQFKFTSLAGIAANTAT